MDIKTIPLKVKAAGPDDGLEDGQFTGYASAFDNVDSYGDIVDKGAFDRTLSEWKERGDTIPVLWGHNMDDPFANIGGLSDASEDENGLKVTGSLDLDNPTAQQVYKMMKGRRTSRMSFAYSVRDSEETDDGNHLKDLDLFEVSVVQVPANQDAQILAVKADTKALEHEVKSGRVLAQKHIDSLRSAQDAIGAVVKAAVAEREEEDQEGKASESPEANVDASAEEPAKANAPVSAEELKADAPVVRLAAQATIYALKGRKES